MPILPDDFIDPELQALVGGSCMTEFRKSTKTALSPNTDECDVNTLVLKALDSINIFGETEIADLLEQLVRRRFEDVLQCHVPSRTSSGMPPHWT
jgi:hypothetical protein